MMFDGKNGNYYFIDTFKETLIWKLEQNYFIKDNDGGIA